MPIRVTCPSCLKKFQVSEQFAGRKGPCPSCKKEITIPDPEKDKVVVHAPEVSGPKDSTGQSVLKPIARSQVRITPVQIAIIAATVATYLIVALAIRFSVQVEDKLEYPLSVLIFGSIAMGPPMAFMGYYFLKDEELGFYRGKELWGRVIGCGLLFAILWLAPLGTHYAFREYSTLALVVAVSVMFAFGGLIATGSFEMEYLTGLIVFGIYFGACILMRIIINAQALPLEST